MRTHDYLALPPGRCFRKKSAYQVLPHQKLNYNIAMPFSIDTTLATIPAALSPLNYILPSRFELGVIQFARFLFRKVYGDPLGELRIFVHFNLRVVFGGDETLRHLNLTLHQAYHSRVE
jgi:hypothetical protein